MSSPLRRLQPAVSALALSLSLLALVGSAAGVGYAAGQIGTSQIKNKAVTTPKLHNNAVTTAKVKDGSLTAKDMVKEEKQHIPTFTNGGEGDCVWHPGSDLLLGLGGPTYRMDRFGRVVLTGIAISENGSGGDTACNESDPGQASDGTAFILPAKYRPAKTILTLLGTDSMLIVGPTGLSSGGVVLPPGAVWSSGNALVLDNISYEPVGSKLVANRASSGKLHPGLAKRFGLN